jgi:uncharacterized protein YecE (DUF72 family)
MAVQISLDLPARHSFERLALENLPKEVRLGTSSWIYPGWKDLIYFDNYSSNTDFRSSCLEEYARFPLFRTVVIASYYYQPLSEKQLHLYAHQTPKQFRWVSKVWEKITLPEYPDLPRHGVRAGAMNENFLDSQLFLEKVLPPFQSDPEIVSRTGPFVFQFSPLPEARIRSGEFLEKLKLFFQALPKNFRYAVEIRNRSLLNSDYFRLLNEMEVAHCFNHWYLMPSLAKQLKIADDAGGLQACFYICRLLTPLGIKHEEAGRMFQPYRSVKLPNLKMREDAASLAHRALERHREVFIIATNRSEGNSPMTLEGIAQLINSEI